MTSHGNYLQRDNEDYSKPKSRRQTDIYGRVVDPRKSWDDLKEYGENAKKEFKEKIKKKRLHGGYDVG